MGEITSKQLATLHSRRALGEFLDLVARYGGDQTDIDAWVDMIAARPQTARGSLRDHERIIEHECIA